MQKVRGLYSIIDGRRYFDSFLIKTPILLLEDETFIDDQKEVALITEDTPMEFRKAVEELAGYFRDEANKSGGIQYVADETHEAYQYKAFLMVERAMYGYGSQNVYYWEDKIMHRVIGACGFTFEEGQTIQGWVMNWVWLHPYRRRRGIMTRVFSLFANHFSSFYCEPPYTTAMENFLQKENQNWEFSLEEKLVRKRN